MSAMMWLDGELVPAARARLDPADRGFTLGDGVFETLCVLGNTPAHLDRHLARLEHGAGVLGFEVPYDRSRIAAAIAAVLAAQGLDEAVVRITLSRGSAARGLLPPATPLPTLAISAGALPPPLAPARVVIAQTTRRNELSPLSTIKSLNYLDNILARLEAARRGDDEAFLLNTQGRIACASIANVFAVIDGIVVTPPVSEGALPGIRRALLLEQGAAIERPLTVAALGTASEIFLTNSLGVRAVVSLEGASIGSGDPGPVFRRLTG